MMRRISGSYTRRGYSLLEMLAIIAVMSVLMSIVATALVAMMRLGNASGERIAWQTTWHRLSLDFRDDVHAAREARLEKGEPPVLRLALPAESAVEYRCTASGIERQRWQGEALVAIELYRLPAAYRAELSLADETGGQFAAIALSRAAELSEGPIAIATQPLRIEALVDRDRRLMSLVAQEAAP